MARLLIDDKLWTLLEPLFPKRIRGTKGGQPPKSDRVCLSGILFVLKTGIPWKDFPQEMGCSGMTLHNRLRQWERDGIFDKIHRLLLAEMRNAGLIDFSRVIADSSSVRVVHGGKKWGQTPQIAPNPAPSIIS